MHGDVLIVDDAPHTLEIMATLLESKGLSVRTARGGRQARSLARAEHAGEASNRSSHGLGLAFCKQAVLAHCGAIHVEAVEPTGSRFVVELPGSRRSP